MSTPFQNRLVGTVIVAAVAIIFLPDLLDGEKRTYQEEFDKIPPAPSVDFNGVNHQFDKEKLAKLSKTDIVDEIAVDEIAVDEVASNEAEEAQGIVNKQTAVTDSNAEVNNKIETVTVTPVVKAPVIAKGEETKTTPLPEKSTLKQAWVIQLGSFRHKNNVDELLKKLKNNGYTAFSKPIKTRNGTLTKVFVGPELSKTSLENKLSALKNLTNVQGKIARFTPTK